MKKHLALLTMIVVLVTSVMAASAQERTLHVFAASSLTDVFEDIAAAFEAEHPGTNVIFSFASSSDLAAQLAEGAPADVFASANTAQMNAAREAGRIAGDPVIFARNRLVLIAPADNPAGITRLRHLANEGVMLVIAAPDVPVRTYTDAMLERLLNYRAYGEAYREAFMANVVSEEQNVRQVSAKVALGEADAGIVYVSDVTPDISDQVIAIPIPDVLNTIATYPIAATNDSANPELAQAFIDYILSDAGQDMLVHWNFVSVRES